MLNRFEDKADIESIVLGANERYKCAQGWTLWAHSYRIFETSPAV
jgi:hypothetical protein